MPHSLPSIWLRLPRKLDSRPMMKNARRRTKPRWKPKRRSLQKKKPKIKRLKKT